MGIVDDSRAKYAAIVRACATEAAQKANGIACSGRVVRLYLYCTRDKRLVLLTREESDAQTPGESELVTGESLPPTLPYEKYFQWVYERARDAPVL